MEPKLNSPHASIEAEIARLSQEMGKRAEAKPEAQREAVREALRERVYTHAPVPPAPSSAATPPASTSDSSVILPRYLDEAPREIKLRAEQLVDTAYHKGLMEAVKQARRAGPLALDAFHDALTDRLYEDLKRRGIIK